VHCADRSIQPQHKGENGLQRHSCPSCALEPGQQFITFNDWTGSVFEQSNFMRPTKWLLVTGWLLPKNFLGPFSYQSQLSLARQLQNLRHEFYLTLDVSFFYSKKLATPIMFVPRNPLRHAPLQC